ncbi:efflux RND transporter periplasmic adaptor subunit [Ascidiimonas sp. W6]|uniref:efflux RND transporter periplasmic adaptor subunit n=1 Tax=Ascidiimonas meishanensis TaxID=3128903 RepID=UPI0030EBD63A
MKKTITAVVLIAIVTAFGGALYYLYAKNSEDPITYRTELPEKRTIVKKTVAVGSILPLQEVLIKPNISGIIEKIYIESGDMVTEGDLIAEIRVVPNLSALNNAKNAIQTNKIALQNQERVFNRQKELHYKGVVSRNDYETSETAYLQAKQSYAAAVENFEIVKTGTTKGMKNAANTNIRATSSGMVLEVPVELGNQVIESNNFNDGTTIATLADTDKMIFKGKVDESEVGKIKENLPLEITVGAIENKTFNAVLDYIAPKGILENGAVQFEIKGTLQKSDSTFIRAGLSANASIILAKAENVLAIKEALVQFDPETKIPFVEIETGDQQFERRDITLGISDGIYTQVTSGIQEGDRIKIWNLVNANGGNN